jgi:superfamily II DNA or RNA helicase
MTRVSLPWKTSNENLLDNVMKAFS